MNWPIKIRIPATTANLGSGFDTLGMALNLYNEIYFQPIPGQTGFTIEIEEEGENFLSTKEDNLVIVSMQKFAQKVNKKLPGGIIKTINRIPVARGMGSSSAAIVGGLFLSNLLLDTNVGKDELLILANEIEGHPDNVAPALFGNLTISKQTAKDVVCLKMPVPTEWQAIVAVPARKISTEDARNVLPKIIDYSKAVKNVSNVAILVAAFAKGLPNLLALGMEDNLHVPYRKKLIPGADDVIIAAQNSGAYCATISGSGSTMIALADEKHVSDIAFAMKNAFLKHGEIAVVHILSVCKEGVHQISS